MADKYIEAVGRRKRSTARVRLFEGNGKSTVNDRPVEEYIHDYKQHRLDEPFEIAGLKPDSYYFTVKVSGGGFNGQVDAVKLGLARCVAQMDEKYRKVLRDKGLLTRDPRKKERKKYFLLKARKRPQYSKR